MNFKLFAATAFFVITNLAYADYMVPLGSWVNSDSGGVTYFGLNLRNSNQVTFDYYPSTVTIYDVGQPGPVTAAPIWSAMGGTGYLGIGINAPLAGLHVKTGNSFMIGDASRTIEINKSGVGDLTIPLGRYRLGAAINFDVRVEGSQAEIGGSYYLSGGWGSLPSVSTRIEADGMATRLAFYGYIDPANSGYGFLFAKWVNASPGKAQNNIVRLKASSVSDFNVSTTGSFASSVLLSSLITIQSSAAGSGNIGIGTLSPTHKLAVNGAIRAKEVIVDTGWADDVFAPGYALMSLKQTEAHITKQGHLPGIPSAANVEAHGVSLGETQAALLRKVEELTLHIIAQEKRIEKLESENSRVR